MGMIKLILPGSYNFDATPSQIVKVGSAGLRGDDLRTFIKRAGTKVADVVQKIAFSPGEIPIHLIAIGATEYYGPNRNGDGFTEECCKKYHDTFVKHARWYRNHQNKDPNRSYGIVKWSGYNDAMHRLELVVALNGTKEAARRNGGLVADKELEMLSSGKDDWGVSMACKVAYDVCSVCGNRARTRDEYCTAETCPGGGCLNNLCKVAEDGTITYVDNPHPMWIDISDVSETRPADRIAYVFGKMQKAASSRVVGGAELAHTYGVTAPLDLEVANVTNRSLREQVKLASDLAEIEHDLVAGMVKIGSAIPETRTQIDGLDVLGRDHKKRANVLKAMAQQKIAMSLTDFIQFTGGYDRVKAAKLASQVRPALAGIFSRMCSDVERLAEDLAHNPFRPSVTEPSGELKMWAQKQAHDGSLDIRCIQHRAWTQAIREESVTADFVKEAQQTLRPSEDLARAYALYKIAFLHEIKERDSDFALTANLVVRQNYIS